jgi:hypothetical protein
MIGGNSSPKNSSNGKVAVELATEATAHMGVHFGVYSLLHGAAYALDGLATAGLITMATTSIAGTHKLIQLRREKKKYSWFWLSKHDKEEVRQLREDAEPQL